MSSYLHFKVNKIKVNLNRIGPEIRKLQLIEICPSLEGNNQTKKKLWTTLQTCLVFTFPEIEMIFSSEIKIRHARMYWHNMKSDHEAK